MTGADRTDPPAATEPTDADTRAATEPTDGAEAPDRTPAARRSRRRATPTVRWIRGLSRAAYAGILLGVVVVLVLLAVLANPGERVGPVQPARPPVGGPGLPATRL